MNILRITTSLFIVRWCGRIYCCSLVQDHCSRTVGFLLLADCIVVSILDVGDGTVEKRLIFCTQFIRYTSLVLFQFCYYAKLFYSQSLFLHTYTLPKATLSLYTIALLFALWWIVNVPLVFLGAALGNKQGVLSFPAPPSVHGPRPIPPQLWCVSYQSREMHFFVLINLFFCYYVYPHMCMWVVCRCLCMLEYVLAFQICLR